MFERKLALPEAGTESFFLWGPRQTGKSTLLRRTYPAARWIDLLKSEEFRRYVARPESLREEIQATGADGKQQIVIDEIQKAPALLNEVHWLMEHYNLSFALCGSSARKVKRGAANLLGGRAIRYELYGLCASELGAEFDLQRMLNHGYLPRIYQSSRPGRMLDAYIADYLKEEVAAEGLVRNLPTFSDFLDVAALSDGQSVNFSSIARDCGVSNQSIKNYFQILEDTLLAKWLPAYRKRPKRRVFSAPRFYFADVGVVNRLARRGELQPGTEDYGKAMENWAFHELSAFLSYHEHEAKLSYWRLASGIEVDFIIGDMQVAIEVKSSDRIHSDHLKGLRNIIIDHPGIARRIVVCREPRPRKTNDGIEIMPAEEFAERLWEGVIITY